MRRSRFSPARATVATFAGAVSALLLIGAGVARAGTYPVTLGPAQCGLFASSATPGFSTTPCPSLTVSASAISGSAQSEQFYKATPPGDISIAAATPSFGVSSNTGTGGWGSGDFWQNPDGSYGGFSWNATGGTETSGTPETYASPVPYWAYQLTCASSCSGGASVTLNSVAFTASESVAPQIGEPTGSPNLFNETSGWVWNPAGDPWPLTVSGSDPSGVCLFSASAGSVSATSPAEPENNTQWQACPDTSWATSVDTNTAQPRNGAMTVTVGDMNAAGVTNGASSTVQVDNTPVTDTLSTPNDPDPGAWVNHAVTVDAAATVGKSGLLVNQCAIDGATPQVYPAGGLTVDGDGVHTATCTAVNNAVDPQGAHNTATASEQIHIDEIAPTIAFEPINPTNPRQLVVDTADGESGVAATTVTMQGPHQAAATALPVTASGSQALANFSDAGKHGVYTFVATSCDNAGNCASTSEPLRLPIRLGSRAQVSFHRIVAATTAKVTHRRITVNGHPRKVTLVIGPGQRCIHRTIKVAAHHRRTLSACRARSPRIVTRRQVAYGVRVGIHGLLETTAGAAIADAPVTVSTRVDKPGTAFHQVLTATTNTQGVWTAKLPTGPNRVIKVHYAGSTVVEPATTTAHVEVAAGIAARFTPHRLAWRGTMHISGQMLGRRGLPRTGLALLLQVRYRKTGKWSTLLAARTHKHGTYAIRWSFHSGRGTATYPFRVKLAVVQSGYPYAVGSSRPVMITFHP